MADVSSCRSGNFGNPVFLRENAINKNIQLRWGNWVGALCPVLCSQSPQFWPVGFIRYLNVRMVFTLKSAFLFYRVYLGDDSANKSHCCWSGAGH